MTTETEAGDEAKISNDELSEAFGEGDDIEVVVELFDRDGELHLRGTVHEGWGRDGTYRFNTDDRSYLLKTVVGDGAPFVDGLIGAEDGRIGRVKSLSKPIFDA